MQLSRFFLLLLPIVGFSTAQSPSESADYADSDQYASGLIYSDLDSSMIQSLIQSQGLNDTILSQNGTVISENGTTILQNSTFSGQNITYPEGGLAGTLFPNGTFAQNGTLGEGNATYSSFGSIGSALGFMGNSTSGSNGTTGGQNGTFGAVGTMYSNGTFVEGNSTSAQRHSSNGAPTFNERAIINGGAIGLIAAFLVSFLV